MAMSFSDGTAMTESPWEDDFTTAKVFGVEYIPTVSEGTNETIKVKIYIKG